MTNQVSASNEIYLRARSQKTFDAHDLSLMRAQCVRTLALGKVHFSLSQSSTFAIRRQSTRHVRWPPWLARSYASVSTPTQPHKDRPPSVDYSTQHKQKAVARSEIHTPTSLQKELRYLGDPRKLADHVLHLLQEGGGDKAYELIKMGSRKLPCTVSWNHLIDFEMSQGRVANACSIFNDMKKRAQKPDAQTYTLLFRGLARSAHYPQSLARTLSIYQSMYADNCPVKPSIIHINAVLKVCARCGDIDALFGVAAKLPTHGAGAPDNRTFTTILNAIRTDAWRRMDDDTSEEKDGRRHRASMQGRRMWGEIIKRWEKGDIVIDEELVCSMGRLLLIADSERNCRDILSLVAQTMGIQQPQSLSEISPRESSEMEAPEDTSTGSGREMLRPPSPSEPDADSDELPDDIPGSEFHPLSEKNSKRTHFAQAGRNTLSMVLDACIRLRAIPAAQDYWGLLTDPDGPHNITPDSENYHMFLRLLRVQRASRLALELVRDMRRGPFGSEPIELEPKTFRIALSACVRDVKNPNVLETADALARMMIDVLPHADVKCLELYLHVAMSRATDWMALMSVLRGSVLGLRNLRSLHLFATSGEISKSEARSDTVSLGRKLVSAFDITIANSNGLMSEQDLSHCREQRDTLMRWMSRANRPFVHDPYFKLANDYCNRLDPDVENGSKTGVATPKQRSVDQEETRQITRPKKVARQPWKNDTRKGRILVPSARRRTVEVGARDRMRRMADLDRRYADM